MTDFVEFANDTVENIVGKKKEIHDKPGVIW